MKWFLQNQNFNLQGPASSLNTKHIHSFSAWINESCRYGTQSAPFLLHPNLLFAHPPVVRPMHFVVRGHRPALGPCVWLWMDHSHNMLAFSELKTWTWFWHWCFMFIKVDFILLNLQMTAVALDCMDEQCTALSSVKITFLRGNQVNHFVFTVYTCIWYDLCSAITLI